MAYKVKNNPFRQLGIATSLFGTSQEPISAASAMTGTAQPNTQPASNAKIQMSGIMGAQPTLQAEMPSLTNTAVQNQVKAPTSVISPTAGTTRASKIRRANMTPMTEAGINPRAFTNSKAIRGVSGRAIKGTFTRSVQSSESPMMQLANPDMLQDGPQLPPEAVQTSVTPTLGFENN